MSSTSYFSLRILTNPVIGRSKESPQTFFRFKRNFKRCKKITDDTLSTKVCVPVQIKSFTRTFKDVPPKQETVSYRGKTC